MNYPILNEEFPGFMAQYNAMYRTMWMPPSIPRDLVDAAIAHAARASERGRPDHVQGPGARPARPRQLHAALDGLQFEEAFVPVGDAQSRNDADPAQVYASEQAYLYALADAMHEEYKAIVDAGLRRAAGPRLAGAQPGAARQPRPAGRSCGAPRRCRSRPTTTRCAGIPEDRVRYHLCWGSMNTPHTSDMPLKDIVDLILKINAQAYSIEAANPRHEHEWMVWQDVKLPEGKILIPGIVSHQTNVVEHPELVAWRIKNYASVVGQART